MYTSRNNCCDNKKKYDDRMYYNWCYCNYYDYEYISVNNYRCGTTYLYCDNNDNYFLTV